MDKVNTFTYKSTTYLNSGTFVEWKVEYGDMVFTGKASSIRQAYRRAKRVLRRHKKIMRMLDNE